MNTRAAWKESILIEKELIAKDLVSLKFNLALNHAGGQYAEIMLDTPSGSKTRCYSIVSAPGKKHTELCVQIIPNGEVSPALSALPLQSRVLIRGPFGNHFIWKKSNKEKFLFIAGGSGIAPFISMLRESNMAENTDGEIILISSQRSSEYSPYRQELEKYANELTGFRYIETFTRKAPENWNGYRKRIDKAMLTEAVKEIKNWNIFISGGSNFIDTMTNLLKEFGIAEESIKKEYFN